jgi:16S rRNA (guanine527-N7)-methyltransferase
MGESESSPSRGATCELVHAAQSLGLRLSSESIERFETYIGTLLLWRSRLSLTTAATPSALVRYHIVDSLFVAPFIQPGVRFADLGSGAGFPGLPLAIVRQDTAVVLIESQRKKANFLREVVRRSGLTNACVVEARAESLASSHLGAYDAVVSRAVWQVPEFMRLGGRLLRPGGLAIAMKGPRGLAECRLQRPVGFSEPKVIDYHLHGGVRRMLLVFHLAAVPDRPPA